MGIRVYGGGIFNYSGVTMFDFTTIEKGSHYVAIKKPTPAIIKALYRLGSEYTQFGHVTENKRKKWAPIKTFVVYSHGGREFRIHNGQFKRLMEIMAMMYVPITSYEIVERLMYDGDDIEINILPEFKLRGQQPEAVQFIEEGGVSPLLKVPMGGGKSQPLDALVKTPSGWVEMGSISVGDTVTAWDGTDTKVVGVYPQGTVPIYRITFSDGRSTECSLDHLWRVTSSGWDNHEKRTRVVKTLEIARLLKLRNYRERLSIDLCLPSNEPDIELPLDPYLLGIFLGDGSMSQKFVMLTAPDEYIRERIAALLPGGCQLVHRSRYDYYVKKPDGLLGPNPLKEVFASLDLMGKYSYNKVVPKLYLEASLSQRLRLIQGLLDADGTVGKDNGTISYCTTSKELSKNFTYLIRSVGGIATTHSRRTNYVYNGEKRTGRISYITVVRYKKPSDLFTLPRKRDLVKDDGQYVHRLRLKIESVEFSRHADAQCIAIDHPDHLYVTNDYIVTHNTLMSLYAAAKRKKRIAIVVLAGFVDKWVGDLQKCTDIQLNEICVVSGSDGLERSSNYPGSGLAMPKAFVISLNSVGRWLTNHEAQPDDDPLPGFSSSPDKYFEHLGIGTIIFDEVHMHPHAIYRIFSYVHVPKTIALTATLETKDPVLRKVQSTMFPKSERFDEIKMKQYIDVVACNYQIAELGRTKIRTSEYGSNSYSQTAFEKSIISDRVVYPQYMKMVIDLIRESYIDKRETGDKLIVFTGTKEMATRLLETSKRLWSTLDIRTYLEGDPFENVIVPDIRFTTVIGGGTAIDIPQLTVAIMTNSIDSPNANLQALGRLREIPGKATTFYYLYSPTLKKQKDYHESKKTLFTGRVKSHGEKMLPAIMGKPPEYERFRQHH